MDGSAELEQPLADLFDCQLVERAQAAVAQMVDVVDVRDRTLGFWIESVGTQVEHVLDDLEEVEPEEEELVWSDVDPGFFVLELAADAEAPDLAQAVAVLVEELLVEELLGFFDLRGVARTQTRVDLEHRAIVIALDIGDLVELLELFFGDGVEDQRVRWVLDHADGFEPRSLDGLGAFFADLAADMDELFARSRCR